MLLQRLEAAQATRRASTSPEFRGHLTEYFLPVPGEGPAPQARLAEQGAHSTLRAHFHRGQQFQVVVRGGGLLGRHVVAPFCVHYSAAETGYGPLIAGPQGLDYLVLRTAFDTTGFMLPEGRAHRTPGLPARHVVQDAPPGALPSAGTAEADVLVPPDATGLAAWRMRLGAGALHHPPDGAAGRFHVVVGGALQHAGQAWGPLSVAWTAPGEPWPAHAGTEGAQVLVLQFPREAPPP